MVTAVEAFAARMRDWRREAGSPSFRALERLTAQLGSPYSRSTIQAKLAGKAFPDWPFVEAFVRACARQAAGPGREVTVDLQRWRVAHRAALKEWEREADRRQETGTVSRALAAVPQGEGFAAVRAQYVRAVGAAHRRINLEVLLTMTDVDEGLSVGLREVFVPQQVRAQPPPVEIPREVRRRLVESGHLGVGEELPEETAAQVERWRQAYRDRPAEPVLRVLTHPGAARVVLLGDPGSGKTTLAKFVLLSLAQADPSWAAAGAGPGQDTEPADGGQSGVVAGDAGVWAGLAGWLPLLVELRGYADPVWRGRSVLDFLACQHDGSGLGLPRQPLEEFLGSDGRAVVVFDGLDEVFDPGVREQITHEIAGFARRYPRARVVVTSRVVGYRRQILADAGFDLYLLQDLDRNQITTFTAGWYRLACATSTDADRLTRRLLDAVAASPAVAELAGNPLLLTLLVIMGRRRELPRERRRLFEYAVTLLTEHWDAERHLPDTDRVLTCEDKVELLQRLARRMLTAGTGLAGNRVDETTLREVCTGYLHDQIGLTRPEARLHTARIVDRLRERDFILSRYGPGMYGFVHRAFLEYLAAADIARQVNDQLIDQDGLTALYAEHGGQEAWQEVLLLLIGLKERFAGPILDALLGADPYWRLRPEPPRHLLLAVRCLAETRPLPALADAHRRVTDTIVALLEHANHSEPYYDTRLLETLRTTLPGVFTVLGHRWAGAPAYHAWWTTRAHSLSTTTFRGELCLLLLASTLDLALLPPDSNTRARLHTQARHTPQPAIRQAAVDTLATHWPEDPDTLPLLRDLATTDQNETVRRAAVQAIAAGWREDSDTLPLLRERATTDQNWGVRATAVEAIAAGWPGDPGTLPWLRERATTDQDEAVRATAVEEIAAGWPGDPGTLPLLRERATTDQDGAVRSSAVWAIAAGWPDA